MSGFPGAVGSIDKKVRHDWLDRARDDLNIAVGLSSRPSIWVQTGKFQTMTPPSQEPGSADSLEACATI